MSGARHIQTHIYNENSGVLIGGNIIDRAPASKQTLAEAAEEIQKLLEQLDRSYPTETTTGKMSAAAAAIEQIEGNPDTKERILQALRAGGTQALKQWLNHPAATFVLAALEEWQKTQPRQE